MALFLNTEKLNYWIPKLIKEAEEELIIIVPYIKTSKPVLNALWKANKRGVQITLIYRENKLSEEEKDKLILLDNLNLLHHPNIHCKTYFNGNLLIIGSMNMYEYSELNNREMGILLNREDHDEIETDFFVDDENVFADASAEIRQIINGASALKITDKSKESGFNIDIIKSDEEHEIEFCAELSKYFLNKRFKPYQDSDGNWYSRCENYYDNVHVTFEFNRVSITFNMRPNELEQLYNVWMQSYREFEFKWFKYYWNYHKHDLLLYRDKNQDWNFQEEKEDYYLRFFDCFYEIIKKYRQLTGK